MTALGLMLVTILIKLMSRRPSLIVTGNEAGQGVADGSRRATADRVRVCSEGNEALFRRHPYRVRRKRRLREDTRRGVAEGGKLLERIRYKATR